jgi:hypothetical protein
LTAACNGATSSLRPGIGEVITFSAAALEAVLVRWVSKDVAELLAPLIAVGGYDGVSLCGKDPPPDPGLQPPDLLALLEPQQPLTFNPAVTKLNAWFQHQYWCIACQCDDGSVPNCGTASNPGPISTNPGLPGGSAQGACWDASTTVHTAVYTTQPPRQFAPELLPGSTTTTVTQPGTPGTTWTANLIPTGVLQLTMTVSASGTRPYGFVGLYVFDSTGTYISTPLSFDFSDPPSVTPNPVTRTAALPANAVSWVAEYESYWGGPGFPQPAPANLTIEFSYTCGTSPNTPVTPCCPPDPTVDVRLRSIQGMLQYLMDQTRPAYTAGTVHAGITGAGTLAISNLVGVKIDITSGVPTNPQLPGTPPYEFSVGWMSVSEPNGMLDEKRITRQHQVWLSGVTPYATVFGYYLNPGFTINVTELIPA